MKSTSLFRNRNYQALLLGNTISSFGDGLYSIALTVSLYQATGKVSAIAFMWLIRAAMRIPIQFLSGIVADSYPKKQLVCFTNVISTPIALGFLFVDSQNWLILYIIIFFLQALNDMEQPAIMGLMQEIVEKDRLKEANATSALIERIVTFASPALAGWLMLTWGVSVLFFMNGISFLLAAVFLSTITYQSSGEKEERKKFTFFQLAKDGYYKALENKTILFMLFIGILPGIMGRFYEIYKVYVSDKLLDLGAEGIVLFSYSMTIGGILSPLILKYLFRSKQFTAGFYLTILLALSAVMTLWGNTRNPVISFAVLTIGGTLFSSVGIILTTYLQENVEKQFIGRIFSLYQMLMMIGAILGILSAPLLLEAGNAGLGFGIVCGICLLALFFARFLGKSSFKHTSKHP